MQETPGSEPPEIRVWTGYEASCSQTPGQSPPSFPEVKVKSLSRVQLCDPCSVAFHAGQSMEFSRQEYWGGLPFPSPGDLPDSGIKPVSPVSPILPADSLPTKAPRKPLCERIASGMCQLAPRVAWDLSV